MRDSAGRSRVRRKLCEMRPQVSSPAHHTDHLAELVCSNSFKSTRPDSAAGLLKAELERMARCCSTALIVRPFPLAAPGGRPRQFPSSSSRGCRRPNIEVVHGEVTQIPEVMWLSPRAPCARRH